MCLDDEEIGPSGNCTPLFSPSVCESGRSVDAAGERCAVGAPQGGSGALGVAAGATAAALFCMCVWVALCIAARRRLRRQRGAVSPAGAEAPLQAGVAPHTSGFPPSPVHPRLRQRSVRLSPAAAAGSAVGIALGTPRWPGAAEASGASAAAAVAAAGSGYALEVGTPRSR